MKLVPKIVISVTVVALVGLGALPTILSQKIVQGKVLAHINSYIPGKIEVENYSLSWFGGIEIDKFSLRDPENTLVAEFEAFKTKSPLFGILLYKELSKETEIRALNVSIVKTESGKTNLEESLDTELLIDLPSPLILSHVDLQYHPVAHQQFTLELTGKTQQKNLQGSFDINLIAENETFHAKANIKDFPVGILDVIAPSKIGSLSEVLGETLNLSVDESAENGKILFTLRANSKNMKVNLEGNLENEKLICTSKGMLQHFENPISWQASAHFDNPGEANDASTLLACMGQYSIQLDKVPTAVLDQLAETGKRFQNALGDKFSLTFSGSGIEPEKINIALNSSAIVIPEGEISFNDLSSEKISGSFVAKSITFQEDDNKSMTDVKVFINFDGKTRDLSASLSAGVPGEGKLSGEFNYIDETSHLYTSLQGNKIPAHFFEMILGQEAFSPIFGHLIDTKIKLDLKGENGIADVRLSGKNGKFILNGNIEDGFLTLNEPLFFQTEPTEQLAKELLKTYLPPLGELVAGDSPITLSIEKEGFHAPLFDFDFNKIGIKKGTLQLGKLTFRNKGEIKKVTKFLNSKTTEKVSLWFTPQYFSMEYGVLALSRMDFLMMDSYPMATWGEIDVSQENIEATLGLSDIALNNAFKIKGLTANTLLQIPIRGSLNKPKVDTTVLLSRVGALLAKQKGSPEGLLLGTVLDFANGTTKEKAPTPTTNPLPWTGKVKEITERE